MGKLLRPVMLDKPSENQTECLSNAQRCRDMGERYSDADGFWKAFERCWLQLHRSYELTERLLAFSNSCGRR